MSSPKSRLRRPSTVVLGLLALALLASACGSRLTASQLAQGTGQVASATGTQNGIGTSPNQSTTNTTAATTGGTGVTGGTGPSSSATGPSTGGSSPSQSSTATTAAPCASGGATATGVTSTSIQLAQISSITGVAPGLTQSAQQATEAWAAMVNATGGICGRSVKIEPFDDANDSGQNFADASQACSNAFALVGSASGFDDGSANAVNSCGIPDLSAEVSTVAAGNTADIFGASPGLAHYYGTGPGVWLKSQYPSAIQHAAMIYLNVPATAANAMHEVQANTSIGFNYLQNIAETPTEANYSGDVNKMQSSGVQYVTAYEDVNSIERLSLAMQQDNYTPQVVDWYPEVYTPGFISATAPGNQGNLVEMTSSAYEEAGGDPGMQTMLTWMNRVAPGFTHDIFAVFAWSADMLFLQAAKAIGPNLTRQALITYLQGVHNWTGGGLTPPENIGSKIPSNCFFYMKISGNSFQRVYPSAPNAYDCNSPAIQY